MAADASDTGQQMPVDTTGPPATMPPPNALVAFDPLGTAVAAPAAATGPRPLEIDRSALNLGLAPPPTSQARLAVPALVEFLHKQTRVSTPGTNIDDTLKDVSRTPWTSRMTNLFPGHPSEKSLGKLIAKLRTIAQAAISLDSKSKRAKTVSVDIETAANLLVLIGAVYDQHQVEGSQVNLFNMSTTTRSRQVVSGPPAPNSDAVMEKLSSLQEQISLLTAAISSPKTALATNKKGYALAASKHATPSTATTTKPEAPRTSKPRAENSITLSQIHASEVAFLASNFTYPALMAAFNKSLITHEVKLKPEDKSPIMVKAVHRHPSNDIVLYVETKAHA
ncbi:hypothetical protein CROQUDRAFT_46723, partial [Cronartium quercuum f. sp. fusiforme G11]